MELMEERLKPYTVMRVVTGSVDPLSGLQTPISYEGGTVEMDIQEAGGIQIAMPGTGLQRSRGSFTGFTYDGHLLQLRDRVDTLAFGSLVVVSIYLWDDEPGEPDHYEIGLDAA